MKFLKSRLALLNFLQFAIWGSYLICLGQFLSNVDLGSRISLFYAVQGIVSIFMPAIIGMIADKYIQGQRLLGICHLLAAAFMFGAWYYASNYTVVTPEGNRMAFAPFFTLYTLSVAFYMPTIALTNTVAFSALKTNGYDTIKDFPPIRVLGTVGFIASMWFVNCFYYHDGAIGFTLSDENVHAMFRFQYTEMMLFMCGTLGLLMGLYSFTMPKVPTAGKGVKSKGFISMLGLDAFKLFADYRMAMFFIFSVLLGASLQVTNGYATPFITSFKGVAEYASTFGANNATLLTSLSQISEALCILMIPFFLRRFGIKNVMFIAMMAWVFRFGCFGLGNPGNGLWLFIVSMLVYGVAFDFFNVSGALFVEQETDNTIKASAQGLFMLMTNGIGATIGTLAAGAVVNNFVHEEFIGKQRYMLGDWQTTWLIFAAYALVVAVLFMLLFRYKHTPEGPSKTKITDAENRALEIE